MTSSISSKMIVITVLLWCQLASHVLEWTDAPSVLVMSIISKDKLASNALLLTNNARPAQLHTNAPPALITPPTLTKDNASVAKISILTANTAWLKIDVCSVSAIISLLVNKMANAYNAKLFLLIAVDVYQRRLVLLAFLINFISKITSAYLVPLLTLTVANAKLKTPAPNAWVKLFMCHMVDAQVVPMHQVAWLANQNKVVWHVSIKFISYKIKNVSVACLDSNSASNVIMVELVLLATRITGLEMEDACPVNHT